MADINCPWKKWNIECKEQCLTSEESDPQKQLVYCFEEMIHNEIDGKENTLTLTECRDIIASICTGYGIWPPDVCDGRGLKVANGSPTKISLPRIYREPISVVHEACHALNAYYDECGEPHGPVFMRFLITHLPKYIPVKARYLTNIANEFGICIAPLSSCLPPNREILEPLIAQIQTVRNVEAMTETARQNHQSLERQSRDAKRRYQTLVRSIHNKIWP